MEREENTDYDLCFPNFPQFLVAYLHWCYSIGKTPVETALEALEVRHPANSKLPIQTILEMFPDMSDELWQNIRHCCIVQY